jgi:hypothetical protein
MIGSFGALRPAEMIRIRTLWIALGALSVLNVAAAAYSARAWLRRDQGRAATLTPAPSSSAPGTWPEAYVPIPDLSDHKPMNGIDLRSVDRFWETWKLVDVRYRSDNGEQRFVYANELAWKTMQEHGARYPDGAMFGKMAFHASKDPAFPASLEPKQFTRLQIMKRDWAAYPTTDGWGYAIVMGNGAGTSADDVQVAEACHACHRLVPDRDFVFSKSPFLGPGGDLPKSMKPHFVAKTVHDLGESEQKAIAEFAGKKADEPVRYLLLALFSGSINEAIPVVETFAEEDRALYLLSDPGTGNFLLADGSPTAAADGGDCKPGTIVAYTESPTLSGLVPESVLVGRMCGGRMTGGRRIRISRPSTVAAVNSAR